MIDGFDLDRFQVKTVVVGNQMHCCGVSKIISVIHVERFPLSSTKHS